MGLRYEPQDRVVTITLDRPEAMNAIDPEMHQDLIEAWTRFRDDPDAWVAILTRSRGEGVFCRRRSEEAHPAGVRALEVAGSQRPGARWDHPGTRDLGS